MDTSKSLIRIARLNHYAGIVFLELGNPVDALWFLEASVGQYELHESKKVGSLSSDFHLDLKQAKVFLARAMIWNYENLEAAEEILNNILKTEEIEVTDDVDMSELGVDNEYDGLAADRIIVIMHLANLFLMEMLLMIETSRLEELGSACAPLYLIRHSSRVPHFRKNFLDVREAICVERFVLSIEYERRFGAHEQVMSMIQMCMMTNMRSPTSSFTAIKALLRYSKIYKLAVSISNAFMDNFHHSKDDKDSCLRASFLFCKGAVEMEQNHFFFASENFKSSFNIRKTILGDKHVETLRSKFMYGCASVNIDIWRCRQRQLYDEEDARHMTDVLQILDGLETKFWFYPEMLRLYATFKLNLGNFRESEKFMKQAIGIQKLLHANKSEEIAVSYMDLCHLYTYFQKWNLILESCLPPVVGWKFERSDVFVIADAQGSFAYSYFKTGQYKKAAHLFNEALAKLDSCYNPLLEFWAILRSKVLSLKMEFEFSAMKKPQVAREIFETIMTLMAPWKFTNRSFPEAKVPYQLGLFYELVEKSYLEAYENYDSSIHSTRMNFSMKHSYVCLATLGKARVKMKMSSFEEGEALLIDAFKHACEMVEPNDSFMEPIFELLMVRVLVQQDLKLAHKKYQSFTKIFDAQNISQSSRFVADFGFTFAKRMYSNNCAIIGLNGCQSMFTRSLEIFAKTLGYENEKTAEIQRMVGLCDLKQGNLREAEWHLFNCALFLQQRK